MDILAAYEELENEERAQKKIAASAAKRKTSQSSGRSGRPRTRSVKSSVKSASRKKSADDDLDNLPPPVIGTGRLTPIPKHRPSAPSPSRSRDSSLGGDSRRISFAEPAPPPARRLYIPTKTASLASGFAFDAKLQKYGVTEGEWAEFSDEVVETANVPTPTWAWFMHKKDVTRRIKRELQYEGPFKRVLRKWNKHFKRKGFQAWLELPVQKGEPMRSQSVDQGDSDDENTVQTKKDEKRMAKRFRMVVSSNVEKGSSVYSRTSSLTRSISREGVTGNPQHRAAQKAHEKATEHAAEQDTEGRTRSVAEDKEAGQVINIDTVNSEDKTNSLEKDLSQLGVNTDKNASVEKVGTPDSKEIFKGFDGANGSKEDQKVESPAPETKSDPEQKLEKEEKVESPVPEIKSDPEQKLEKEEKVESPAPETKLDPEQKLEKEEKVESPVPEIKSDPEQKLEKEEKVESPAPETKSDPEPNLEKEEKVESPAPEIKSDPEQKLEKEGKATKDDKDEK